VSETQQHIEENKLLSFFTSGSTGRIVLVNLLAVTLCSSLAYAAAQYLRQEIRKTGRERQLNFSIYAPYGGFYLSGGTSPGVLAVYETSADNSDEPQVQMRYALSGSTGVLKMSIGADEGSLRERPLAVYRAASPFSVANFSPTNVIQSDYGFAKVLGDRDPWGTSLFNSSINTWAMDNGQSANLAEASATAKVNVTKEFPLTFGAEIGFGEAVLDLSGLALQSASIETGASRSRIILREPNPVTMGLCEISAGVGQCVVEGLSNLNARRVEFSGGIGSYQLSFGGKLQQNMDAEVSVGVGKVAINIPPDAGRVQVFYDDGLFSSCQFSGLTKKRDGYATSVGFDQSTAPVLTLRLSTALGKMVVSYR